MGPTAWTLLGKIVTALSAVVANALLARYLAPADVGRFFLVQSTVLVLSVVVQFGVGQAIVRHVAQANKTISERNSAIVAAIVLPSGIAVILSSLAIALESSKLLVQWKELGIAPWMVCVWTSAQAISFVSSEIFRGLSDFRYASLFGGAIAGMVSVILLSLFPEFSDTFSLRQAIGIICLAYITSTVYALASLVRKCRISHRNLVSIPLGVLLRSGLPITWTNLLVVALYQVDIWLVGVFRPGEEVALYGAATRLASIITLIASIPYGVLPPVIAVCHAEDRTQDLERACRSSATLTFAAAFPVALVLVIFSESILGLFFGEFYRSASFAMAFLIGGHVLNAATGVRGYALIITGHERTQFLLTLAGGGVTALLCAFAANMGSIGLVAAAAMAGMIFQCLLELVYVGKILGVRTYMDFELLHTFPRIWRDS